jgi:hypothetical protein
MLPRRTAIAGRYKFNGSSEAGSEFRLLGTRLPICTAARIGYRDRMSQRRTRPKGKVEPNRADVGVN